MLEKPGLDEELLADCLQAEYELRTVQVSFLPLGADFNTAVYRVRAEDDAAYFLKLRRGPFHEISVALPKYLSDRGVKQIIAPCTTKNGQLWAGLLDFKVILYPFVDGRDGYQLHLSKGHWAEFGRALKRIHSLPIPAALTQHVRQERFSDQWRESVKATLELSEGEVVDDPVAQECAAFLKIKRQETLDLVERAEKLASVLQKRPPPFILCHSDLHAGNILIDGADLYIVDWDEPILAPKERDLMYVGGGLLNSGRSPGEEEELFYQAYGLTDIDPAALTYYRYERIVEDIALYSEQLLLGVDGGEDRAQSLYYLKSNFLPGHTIEIAHLSDRSQ